MALISIKDVKQAIRIMMQILEKLDEIYHALHDSINDAEGKYRDQNEETLKRQLEKKYKEIDSNYRMLRKVSNIEDAKMLIDEIWQMKDFANTIEMELMRREYSDGTTS